MLSVLDFTFPFSNIQHTMQCVSVLLVQISRAGLSAVLGSLSLPALTPLLLLGAGVRGTRVLLGHGLYLTPFMRC